MILTRKLAREKVMHIDFVLPQKWIDPRKTEHVLLVANRIVAIRYGEVDRQAPSVILEDGKVSFPLTNDHWLISPQRNVGQPNGHWRLIGRYDDKEALGLIVRALQLWL